MATKTFKIGECAIGGIIQVKTTSNIVKIKALDWHTKEVVMEDSFLIEDSFFYDPFQRVDDYLNELTSCYYADKVLSWIKPQIKLNS